MAACWLYCRARFWPHANIFDRRTDCNSCEAVWPEAPLLIWINSNPNMDKLSHDQYTVDEITYPFLTYPFPNFTDYIVEVWEWDKYFHPTLDNGCNYVSMLGLKLIHISKDGLGTSRVGLSSNVTLNNAFVKLVPFWPPVTRILARAVQTASRLLLADRLALSIFMNTTPPVHITRKPLFPVCRPEELCIRSSSPTYPQLAQLYTVPNMYAWWLFELV